MKNISKQDILMYLSIILFCMITIPKLINHIPWHDECLAWIYAREMTFNNVVQILGNQGHFIVWYLLLMPFAKSNFYFPYSMLLVNWVCYFAAILIMWKKAPFHPVVKIIITFSWLSLNYFSIVSRWHSAEILELFLVVSLYKDQMKRPILYTLLLVLTAHTHLFGAIAVTPLALIFIHNLIKNKNNFSTACKLSIFLIFTTGVVLWLYPILCGTLLGYNSVFIKKTISISDIIRFYRGTHYLIFLYYLITSFIIFILANNKTRFFILTTNIIFIIFHATLYIANNHNMIFLYVYLILAYWLIDKIHTKPVFNTLFIIFFACLSFYNSYYLDYTTHNIFKLDLIKYLNNENDIKNIYIFEEMCEIEPFLDSRFQVLILNNSERKNISKNVIPSQKTNTLIITKEKINDTSIPFKYGDEYETIIWYVTRAKLLNKNTILNF